MTDFQTIVSKIENAFEDQCGNNFHSIFVMVDTAIIGRICRYYESEELINSYFNYSPEVFEEVKTYSVSKSMKFLESIISVYGNMVSVKSENVAA